MVNLTLLIGLVTLNILMWIIAAMLIYKNKTVSNYTYATDR